MQRIYIKKKNCRPVVAATILLLCLCSFPALAVESTSSFYKQLHEFHGHTCGGSLMGARLGLAARGALDAEGGSRKYQAEYFDHSCPVDGIQMAAGTTYGNRRITVVDQDEHRLILTDTKTGRMAEAKLTPLALEKASRTRELSKQARKLRSGSKERVALETEIESIFDWLRSAEEHEVVSVHLRDAS